MKRITVGLIFTLFVSNAIGASDVQLIENISQELVKIRQEIELLHSNISFEKDKYRDQMRSFSSQKSDLEVRISRSELNIKDLQRELKKLTDQNREKNRSQTDVVPIIHESVDALRKVISESLPFKLNERINALNEIQQRMDSAVITPNKAANQLWAYIEDEFMLGKSSGIYNDMVTIDGSQRLVKVLRIGKIAMFYKASDDHYGVMKMKMGKWKQEILDDKADTARLNKLFDSYNKNIQNGQFVVPNILPKV